MIVQPTPPTIEAAARALRAGELVAFPTETVYGLGANALNAAAVEKIYQLKGRPPSNPVIVHCLDLEEITRHELAVLDARTEDLLHRLAPLFPGPLTVVVPRGRAVPSIVTAQQDSVALRFPAHPIARALLTATALPLAAPSANRSSYVSPTSAQDVADEFGDRLGIILDGGASPIGVESTVLSLIHPLPQILRPGSVTLSQLEALVGEVTSPQSPEPHGIKRSPGLLDRHYSPRTPVIFYGERAPHEYPAKVGLIRFSEGVIADGFDYLRSISLSTRGDLEEAARNLYRALRDLDREELDLIVVERCAETGIGVAIMDRLRRATSSSPR